MKNLEEKSKEIEFAVKEFASSINSITNSTGDMSSLVETTSKLELKNIDHYERLIRDEFVNYSNLFMQSKWKFWVRPIKELTWLDVISSDGYKREEGLYALSGAAPNAFFLTLVIRRLNDWVPQVREAAKEVIPSIIEKSKPEDVIEALTAVFLNWDSWGKIAKADRQMLLHISSIESLAVGFKSKLISSISGPMPSLFSQLGRIPILDECLNEIANNAMQPHMRAKAFRSLFEKRIFWIVGQEWKWTDKVYNKGKLIPVIAERKISVKIPFSDLLNTSAFDRSSIVRQVSAEFLIRDIDSLGNQTRTIAEKFAADKSNTVSERGRFILKKLDEMALNNN